MVRLNGVAFGFLYVVLFAAFGTANAQGAAHGELFKTYFFEALKQSSLENPLRAIESLKACDSIEPDNAVVAFQLAKNYEAAHQHKMSEAQYLRALKLDPSNKWFLQGYYRLARETHKAATALEALNKMAREDSRFGYPLAFWYANAGDFEHAQKVASSIKDNTQLKRDLHILYQKKLEQKNTKEAVSQKTTSEATPLAELKNTVSRLILENNYDLLAHTSKEAVEVYPSQASFYYAYGLALMHQNKPKESQEQLLLGLEFLVDDSALQDDIYTLLSEVCKALGDTEKMIFYTKKITRQ